MPSNTNLWQGIRDFAIDDPGAAFPFSARLAHENGWSAATAAAAIDEYRKFIYLIGVSGSPLTPSEAVDQVWHLHLLYSRSYWTEFCGGVLGRPLHHEPTRGGEAQGVQFRDQYAQTLTRYEAEFGGPPPAEFWPVEPFGALPNSRWVDRRTHWIVPKRIGRRLAEGAVVISIALLASCNVLTSAHAKSHTGVWGDVLAVAIPMGLIALALTGRRADKRDPDSDPHAGSHNGFSFGGCAGCGGGGCGGCGGCGG